MRRRSASSSGSTVDGVHLRTRSSSSVRRSPSTDPKRKLHVGSALRPRRLTCRGTRSTLGPSVRRPGCPSTAPTTGCARSTATSHGTSSCDRKEPSAAVHACMSTRRTIRGCIGDRGIDAPTGLFHARGLGGLELLSDLVGGQRPGRDGHEPAARVEHDRRHHVDLERTRDRLARPSPCQSDR